MGKNREQHLQDSARYTAAPESIEKATAKRKALLQQEQRLATPPPQPNTAQDDAAHDLAMAKLRSMGIRSAAL